MKYRSLALEQKGHIRYLTLSRPSQGNLVDAGLLDDLAAAAAQVNDDEGAYVAVLTGGGDVFCLGWDASLLQDETPVQWARRQKVLSGAFSCLNTLAKPVIAAINGDALSAGLEMALACDVRIAATEARFGLPETGFGLVPMGGGTQRLARAVGRAKALEMVLTGEIIDAEEALRIGLVSRVVPRDALPAEATTLAERIASRGPIAVRYAKEAVLRGIEMPLEQALRYETDLTIILQTTEDRAEGVRAFLDKRKADFKGR